MEIHRFLIWFKRLNGKGKSKVYVNGKNEVLSEKMNNLEGYVVPFSLENDAVDIIIDENPEIC